MTIRVPIREISFEPDTQVRQRLDQEAIADYVEILPHLHVTLFRLTDAEEKGRKVCVDGHLTLAAAVEAGREFVDAEVLVGTLKEAVHYATGANKRNGHRLKRDDAYHAVELLDKYFPVLRVKNDKKAVAEHVGISESTVTRAWNRIAVTQKTGPLQSTSSRRGRSGAEGRRGRDVGGGADKGDGALVAGAGDPEPREEKWITGTHAAIIGCADEEYWETLRRLAEDQQWSGDYTEWVVYDLNNKNLPQEPKNALLRGQGEPVGQRLRGVKGQRKWTDEELLLALSNLYDERVPQALKDELLAGLADPVKVLDNGQFALHSDTTQRFLKEGRAADLVVPYDKMRAALAAFRRIVASRNATMADVVAQFSPDNVDEALSTVYGLQQDIDMLSELLDCVRRQRLTVIKGRRAQ